MSGSAGQPLSRLDAVIDWEGFRPHLEQAMAKPAKGPGGRPANDPLMLLACNGIPMYRMTKRSIRSSICLCVVARRQVA